MPALHIRDLSTEVVDALKRRARRHHRSLQKELHSILTEAAEEAESARKPLPPIRLIMSDAAPQARWSRSEIYEDEGR